MYNFDNIQETEKLTKDTILNKVSEESIFRHYLGFDFKVNKPYHSPLREDKNPSFALYYTRDRGLRFKDFNGCQGTCFDLVMHLHGVSFNDALKLINNHMGLNIGKVTNLKEVTRKLISQYKPEVLPKRERLIQFKPQHWTKTDAEYWKQYGITSKILKKYNVFSSKYVFLDKELILTYTNDNPVYAYKFGKHVKIYRPYAEKNGFKWMSNVNKDDLQGMDQLDLNLSDTLIVTKSLKDVMCLNVLGYQAVAPQSENTRTQFELIKTVAHNFSRVIILFDNDEAGQAGAELLVNFFDYPVKNIIIQDNSTKDISDYISKYGVKNACNLIKILING
tara:strand:+ start:3167 stop:4171 length:1005 start_codon:yes stop_codon:yes gene_type:complete